MEDFCFTVSMWIHLVAWGPRGDMIWDQMESLVVIQVPCSYMTSQSDLLICLTISCPNTHKGQINIAGCDWLRRAGRWARWGDRARSAGVWRDTKSLLWCFSSRLLFVDEYVMCKQVNNSTWLQHGSCLFSLSLAPVKTSVNNTACCMCDKDEAEQIVVRWIFSVDH